MKTLSKEQLTTHKDLKFFAKEEKKIEVKIISLMQKAESCNLALAMGFKNLTEYCKIELGLSESRSYKRYQAMRVLRDFPEFNDIFISGKTHVSTLATIGPKVTRQNRQAIIDFLPKRSNNETKAFLSTLNADGSHQEKKQTVKVTLELTLEELEHLKKAQTLMAQSHQNVSLEKVVVTGTEKLLDLIDPARKAQRAQARAGKKADLVPIKNEEAKKNLAKIVTRPVPMKLRHETFLRDEGQCTFYGVDGRRCSQTAGLQVDHSLAFAFGGEHKLSNLKLLCARHNQLQAKRDFPNFKLESTSPNHVH